MTEYQNWGTEPRPEVANDPWSTDFDQVRATVQALQGAATLLQGAMEQRQGLWSEMRSAEQKLNVVEAQRREAEQAVVAASAQLERTARDLDQVRQEQNGVLSEFDRLVQSALARRTALLAEISELERQRNALATGVPPARGTVSSTPSDFVTPEAAVSTESLVSTEHVRTEPAVPREPAVSLETIGFTESFVSTESAVRTEPAFAREPAASTGTAGSPTDSFVYTESAVRTEPDVRTESVVRTEPAVALQPCAAPGPPAEPHVAPEPTIAAEPVAAPEPVAMRHALPPIVLPVPPMPRKRRRFGLRALLTLVLGTALLGLAVLLTPVTQLAGGLQLMAVLSGSMEPTIHVGGVVGVLPTAASDLRVGDVITFANQSQPDVLVTHRIVSIEERGNQELLTTRGDANDSADAVAVSANRTVGRVWFTLPWLGYAMVYLGSPLAKICILAVAALGLVLPSLKRSTPTETTPEDAELVELERELKSLLPKAS
jgi:signal peptidase